jgi:hypothetical protein
MNFEEYYQTYIVPIINNIELYRKSSLFAYCRNNLIIFVSFLFCVVCIDKDFYSLSFIDIKLPVLVSSFLAIIWLIKKNQKICWQYKIDATNLLYQAMVRFYPNLHYSDDEKIDIEIIANTFLFPSFNNYLNKNYIWGSYKNVNLVVSELLLENITMFENKVVREKLFKGLFCIVSLQKNYNSITYVVPNRYVKFLHQLPKGLQRVKLEDPNFEDIFDVYGDNQIQALKVLTPAFMERLLQLNQQNKINCCFLDDKLYLALELDEDLLPQLQLTTKINRAKICQAIENLAIFFEIIDVLKLEIV